MPVFTLAKARWLWRLNPLPSLCVEKVASFHQEIISPAAIQPATAEEDEAIPDRGQGELLPRVRRVFQLRLVSQRFHLLPLHFCPSFDSIVSINSDGLSLFENVVMAVEHDLRARGKIGDILVLDSHPFLTNDVSLQHSEISTHARVFTRPVVVGEHHGLL